MKVARRITSVGNGQPDWFTDSACVSFWLVPMSDEQYGG